jgi:hypothetical protein
MMKQYNDTQIMFIKTHDNLVIKEKIFSSSNNISFSIFR